MPMQGAALFKLVFNSLIIFNTFVGSTYARDDALRHAAS